MYGSGNQMRQLNCSVHRQIQIHNQVHGCSPILTVVCKSWLRNAFWIINSVSIDQLQITIYFSCIMTSKLQIRPKSECKWDIVSLGEVMLRLDPGDMRIATTREFRVWEGGGEYNVARGLKRCFGLDATAVTAFADNPVGRLLQDLMYQGGVD